MAKNVIGHADRKWIFQGMGLTIVVIVLALLFSLINPRFATLSNFLTILTQASYYIILAVGMTFVITSAGIDLSVGSILALITVIGFELIKGGMHPLLGVLIMFFLGGFIVTGCQASTIRCQVTRTPTALEPKRSAATPAGHAPRQDPTPPRVACSLFHPRRRRHP